MRGTRESHKDMISTETIEGISLFLFDVVT